MCVCVRSRVRVCVRARARALLLTIVQDLKTEISFTGTSTKRVNAED